MSQEYPSGGGQREIRPGPLRGQPAPEIQEIACIAVDRVYDFCFDEETTSRTVTLRDVPIGTPVTARLNTQAASCQVLGDCAPTGDGQCDVTLAVSVPATVQVGKLPAITVNFLIFKPVRLYMPHGTTLKCEVTGNCFGALIDADGDGMAEELFCQASLCTVVQVTARVNLLIPAYGFATPGPMRPAPGR